VISFFPLFAAVTAQTMNYGVVMFAGVAVIAMVNYLVHGRKVYKGPVVYVNRD
jgi:choline transport protein